MTAEAAPRRTPGIELFESEELISMTRTVRDLFRTHSTVDRVSEVADGPLLYDERLWQMLSADLGVTGILVPEEFGGLGMTWREARVVLAEQGRALACVPYLSSSIIAVSTLLASDDKEACVDVLPGLADGSAIAAVGVGDVVLLEPGSRGGVKAQRSVDGSWQLEGRLEFVLDGMVADWVLVLAATDGLDSAWFLVDTTDNRIARQAMAVVDTTRPQAVFAFQAAPARLIGAPGAGSTLLDPTLDAAVTGLACEQAAASQHLLDMTVEYASSRYQFGQPIGSFQGIQHQLADLALLVDTAHSAVEYAVWASCDDPRAVSEAASLAAATCSEANLTMASEAIQLHGGIGFTWEHPAHRYYRRALTSWSLFGKPSYHRERLLRALAI